MRADAQKISDVIERFNQERLSHIWCHECNYGFLTFQSWQVHHTEVHINNARNH